MDYRKELNKFKTIEQLDKLESDMNVIFMKLENAELKHIKRIVAISKEHLKQI